MSVYTKTGDKGETSLANGQRLKKSHPIFTFVGLLDELNSILGMCLVELKKADKSVDFINEVQFIASLQNDLFTVGSLVVSAKLKFDFDKKTSEFESMIDAYEAELPQLRHFVLPGGSTPATWLHLARVKTREVERVAVACQKLPSQKSALAYFNRLSDLLFVMARWTNFKLGVGETTWKSEF
jgi:cob(I)alamin adenosyltransferase